jgi:hypothetical protein
MFLNKFVKHWLRGALSSVARNATEMDLMLLVLTLILIIEIVRLSIR